ncbi:response regulator [Pseudomonas typographi]|uniref:response regulator n=1 Tax=Pseudomonas typographi TaxID=2715964 RepID=UPI0016889879|nr:response regulator [Pseudomonas typographi]MBD1554152.1 response regulator [Pseudomonas typographi]
MLSNHLVAVAEDDPLLRQVLAELITELNGRCEQFTTCDDLYRALLAGRPYTLVITDHITPGSMQGIELASAAEQGWPGLTVIIMSGHERNESVPLPSNSHYFQKPLQITDLLDVAENILKTSQRNVPL